MPTPTDAGTLQAVFEGVENARSEAETEWGFERLPMLVSDDLRAKLYRQKAKWSEAYQAAWAADVLTRDMLAEVEKQAGAMKRAWAALSQAASDAGHRAVKPWVWEVPLANGTVAALVRTDAEVADVEASGRFVSVYTAREIGNIIDALPPTLVEAKRVFPGSKFQGSFDRSWVKDGDELPF
jgi:hypothetical protein